jgi:hypothetical protein
MNLVRNRIGRLIRRVTLAAGILGLPVWAQLKISITSPSDGGVVNPGSSFAVTVTASPADGVRRIVLLPQYPLKVKGEVMRSAPPYQFTVEVPENIWADRFGVSAIALLADGPVRDGPIEVDVERADPPVRLETQLSYLGFDYIGDMGHLLVYGYFADGSKMDLTHSSLTRYVPGSVTVVRVSREGLATATGPGSTIITVENKGAKALVKVFVASGKQPRDSKKKG